MNIAILCVDNNESGSPIGMYEPEASPENWFDENDTWEKFHISEAGSVKQIKNILKRNFDLYINLCDGAEGESRPGIEVVKTLEAAGAAFTGAGSSFYDPRREEMKTACLKCGIPVPSGKVITSSMEITEMKNRITFPLIVKHPDSYNSVGLTKKSVVNTVSELICQSEIMIKQFGSALVEEYIGGREFTALVAENCFEPGNPHVFPPAEVIFPEGESIKHFALKWQKHSTIKHNIVNDNNIAREISGMSALLFKVMNGNGYARCDLRMDRQGKLFILEINPNCSIFYPHENSSSADDILYSVPQGHREFIKLITENAVCRKFL